MHKLIKNFGEKGAWAYSGRDCPIFWGTPFSEEQVKLRTFLDFVRTFTASIGIKAHSKFREK